MMERYVENKYRPRMNCKILQNLNIENIVKMNKQMLQQNPREKQKCGRSRKRWLKDVEDVISMTEITNQREKTGDRKRQKEGRRYKKGD